MSEYQYYEFLAIDRSLTNEEQRELRRYSTRAQITSSRFTNEYHWGNFKGDVEGWMDSYFDVFLYFADWGSRTLKIRLSQASLSTDAFSVYSSEVMYARDSGDNLVLSFELEGDGEEPVEDEPEIASLIGIREELLRGDRRSLYWDGCWALNAGNSTTTRKSRPSLPA